jgi:hypothetical protein
MTCTEFHQAGDHRDSAASAQLQPLLLKLLRVWFEHKGRIVLLTVQHGPCLADDVFDTTDAMNKKS